MKPYLELLKKNQSPYQTPEIAYLAKLISDVFQSINRGHDPRNSISNERVCLVILSLCQYIYQHLLKC